MTTSTTGLRVQLARRATRLATGLPSGDAHDIISLGSGHGFPGVFPDLTEMARVALNNYRSETLQYGPTLGLPEMREWIAGYMRENGAKVTDQNVLIVNGAKHGLDLISRLLLDEGDTVVVTAPTYFTGIPIFKTFGANFIEVSQDVDGIVVKELEEVLERRTRAGEPLPKLIYNVPDYHNPAGVTMSRERRQALVDLADAYGIYIVEDSPYRRVRFEGEQLPMIKAFDRADTVFVLGTFSKLVAPGLRIGWVVTSSEMVARLAQLKSDLGSCPLTQRIILEFCKGNHLAEHTERVQALYRSHRDAMVKALREHLPEASFHVPQGGYYLWLTLPAHVDADKLTARALEEKVGIIPGSKFFAGNGPKGTGAPKNHIRLCYSHANPTEIVEGVKRLARAVHSMIA
ncbi:MAG TPA: PLP-dependent aminotransferase family protein [Verrucomicrobiae bacterium]|jgi:2-aminoadipate transaminase|nr:PLP-dependent aminotransferase family protein [Verrucomicrobiae bacterium]